MTIEKMIHNLIEALITDGNIEVDISLLKQYPNDPKAKELLENQQYLVSSPQFFVVEKTDEGKRLWIRDWPY